MDSNSFSLELSSLLAHERDLTRLARRLLTRDADAEDAVQDTLHTLLSTRPPEARSLTAWLRAVLTRRVVDGRRTAAARASREARAARPEALPSSADALTRIELQRQIAAAVLALDEPYRSVVAAHHFEGRSVADIARSTGRSQGTVRSQLSRAHGALRARLQREVDGGLHALSLLLVARGPSSLVVGSAVAAVILSVIGVLALRSEAPQLAESAALPSAPRVAELASALEATGPRAERSEARLQEEQALALGPTASDLSALAGLGPAELYIKAMQVRRLLAVKSFEPAPELVRAHANLLRLPRAGLSRVRAGGDSARENAFHRKTGILFGGTGLSFSNGGHSHHARCDIWHKGKELESLNGRPHYLGRYLPLGDRSLEELDAEPPRGLDETLAAAWRLCRTPREELIGATPSALRQQLDAATLTSVPIRAGASFLMRSYESGDRDLLAAFRIVEVTDVDATIAWRVLEEYPLTDRTSAGFEALEAPWIPAPNAGLTSLSAPELERRLEALQARGLEVLTSLPDPARALVPSWFVDEPGVSGTRRLLIPRPDHWSWRPLLYDHDGGTRCSFLEGHPATVSLMCNMRGSVMTSMWEGSRPILPLGVLSDAEQMGVFGGLRPASLTPAQAAGWDIMLSAWTDVPGAGDREQVSRRATLRAAGVDYPTYVAPGCTYLLRTGVGLLTSEASDSVVAFTILYEDDYGYSLIWCRLVPR